METIDDNKSIVTLEGWDACGKNTIDQDGHLKPSNITGQECGITRRTKLGRGLRVLCTQKLRQLGTLECPTMITQVCGCLTTLTQRCYERSTMSVQENTRA